MGAVGVAPTQPEGVGFTDRCDSLTSPHSRIVVDPAGIEPALSACKADVLPLSLRAQSWWTQRGSNSRPHDCQPCAPPTELCAHKLWSYIRDLNSASDLTKVVLRHLSLCSMVFSAGLEPAPQPSEGCTLSCYATRTLEPDRGFSPFMPSGAAFLVPVAGIEPAYTTFVALCLSIRLHGHINVCSRWNRTITRHFGCLLHRRRRLGLPCAAITLYCKYGSGYGYRSRFSCLKGKRPSH